MTDFRFSGRRKTNGPSIHALNGGCPAFGHVSSVLYVHV